MERKTDPRLGWQGWLWLIILAVCLAALALGLGYRYGTDSIEDSAGAVSSVTGGVSQTINLFPASTGLRSESGVALPGTAAPSGGVPSTTVLGSSTDRRPTSRLATASTTTRRSTSVSTTTRRPTTVSVTTAAAETVRLASTATPSTATPSTGARSTVTRSTVPTTSTSEPTTTTTRWAGPVAVDDHVAVDEGKEVKPKVLDNDSSGNVSLDEDTLSIAAGPANAESYRVHNDHLHYQPADGFVGVDRLRYRICDDDGRCDTATVIITVG